MHRSCRLRTKCWPTEGRPSFRTCANTGGVIVSYVEWLESRADGSGRDRDAGAELRKRIHAAYREIAARAEESGLPLRAAAYGLSVQRVAEAAGLSR